MTTPNLPETMKALVLKAPGSALQLKDIPTPQPTPGAVVVKMIASWADSSLPYVLTGQTLFTFPTPFVPGTRAIGRVAATGPDAIALTPGQLVMVEPFVRGRDEPNAQILWGAFDGPTPAIRKWTKDNWANATMAEYFKAPLENTWALNENRLCKELGYSVTDLIQLTIDCVGFGGLRSLDLKAGERVIVTPATGSFSGSTIGLAVAMGASVIAVGRNAQSLKIFKDLYPSQVEIVVLTGDEEADKKAMMAFGPVDAVLEMSPMSAAGSTHVKSAIGATKQYGSVVMMGMLPTNVEISYMELAFKCLTLRGQYMYEREDVRALIKMAESGVLKLGKERGQRPVQEFKFGQVEEAFQAAQKNTAFGNLAVVMP